MTYNIREISEDAHYITYTESFFTYQCCGTDEEYILNFELDYNKTLVRSESIKSTLCEYVLIPIVIIIQTY